MKTTQILDAVRNIKKQIVSWISIIVVANIAVAAFLSMRFSSESLQYYTSKLYSDQNFRDLQIISSQLLTDDDIKALQKQENVLDAEGYRFIETELYIDGTSNKINISSLTERMNIVELREGRLPEAMNECLIDVDSSEAFDISIGDTIYTRRSDFTNVCNFVVVGIIVDPELILGNEILRSPRSVFVKPEVFKASAFDNAYPSALVKLDVDHSNYCVDKYLNQVASAKESLEDFGTERALLRTKEIKGRYQEGIDEATALLNEKKQELADGRKQLDDGWKEVEIGEQTLEDTLPKLTAAKAELDAGKSTLDKTKVQLDDAANQLAAGKQQLDEAQAQLNDARSQLTSGYQQLIDYVDLAQAYAEMIFPEIEDWEWVDHSNFNVDDPNLTLTHFQVTKDIWFDLTYDIQAALDELKAHVDELDIDEETKQLIRDILPEQIEQPLLEWERGHNQYIDGRNQFLAKQQEYNDAYNKYQDGLRQYQNGYAQYEAGLRQYQDGMNQYYSGKEQLEDARKQLEEKEKEYEDGVLKIEEAEEQIKEVEKERDAVPEGHWIYIDAKGNPSYRIANGIVENYNNISNTFCLLFIFVGALVIYSTVGKTIESQRTLVGTTKALGFFNSEVLIKYLSFGLSATIVGVILGILMSYFIMGNIFLLADFQVVYIKPQPLLFNTVEAIIALIGGILVATLSAYFACTRLIKTPATYLMKDAVPLVSKKSNRKPIMKQLYPRLILRNMLSDPKRILITIVSIAGSCALILMGFSVSYSMKKAGDLQFDDLYRFQYYLRFDKDMNPNVEKEVEKVLSAKDANFIKTNYKAFFYEQDGQMDTMSLYSGNLDELQNYIRFPDPKTNETLQLEKDGIYVPILLQEKYQVVDKGTITLFDSNMNAKTATIKGDFMAYVARFAVCSEEYYEELFGEEFEDNQYLIQVSGDDSEMVDELSAISGVTTLDPVTVEREVIDKFNYLVDYSIMLLTGLAFMLAYFILLNLINMYISQKRKELTVMRINGFTVSETKRYVIYEIFITTVLGIILGIVIGSMMALYVVVLSEFFSRFYHKPYLLGWLISGGITAIFSIIISYLALRQVKNLSLTDIN